jgi:hypothetical protein
MNYSENPQLLQMAKDAKPEWLLKVCHRERLSTKTKGKSFFAPPKGKNLKRQQKKND